MIKTYKIEIELNDTQKEKYFKTIGVCRFVYNLYIQKNKELYQKNKNTKNVKFLDECAFSKWLNNEFIPTNTDHLWIKDVSSKSVKYAIHCASCAFKRMFKLKLA